MKPRNPVEKLSNELEKFKKTQPYISLMSEEFTKLSTTRPDSVLETGRRLLIADLQGCKMSSGILKKDIGQFDALSMTA